MKSEIDEKVLEYTKSFMLERGYTPSMREIMEGVGFGSTNTAHNHFMNLVRDGEIVQYGNRYTVKGLRFTQDEVS